MSSTPDAASRPSAQAPTADPPTVLVGLHDMSRTGVPIVLLRLLRASSPRSRSKVHVVSMTGGPLLGEFSGLAASVTVLEPTGRRTLAGGVVAGVRSLAPGVRGPHSVATIVESGLWRARLSLLARLPRPDVLVIHGAGAWPLVGAVSREVPVLLHLHELATGLDRSIPARRQAGAMARAKRIMVVSSAVADLACARGATSGKIEVVPGVVEPGELCYPGAEVVIEASRNQGVAVPLLDPSRRWAVGMGVPGWRKGTDRMPTLAFEVARRLPSSSVAWVGGRPTGQNARWVDGADPVTWIGETDDPWMHVPNEAVVVIPSREDPMPLVALEAGQRGHAVVAMATGGLVELLADGRGLLAGRQSMSALTDATETVLADPGLAGELGAALREHVGNHHSAAVVAPQWWNVIRDAAAR